MTAPKLICIVNPRGGARRGRTVLETVKPLFAAADVNLEVHTTNHAGHATQLAEALDLEGCDGLCVVGGDGTLHEVVTGLMLRDRGPIPPLGVIPAGTGNSVSLHFGCTDPTDAVQRILAGNILPLDLARVTTPGEVTWCINLIGWGVAVDINRTAERLRGIGSLRYSLAALTHIALAKRRAARLVLDGQLIEDDFFMIAACNTKFVGKGMLLAPTADIGDGKLEVVVVRNATRRQMTQLFRRVFDGSHVSLPCVEIHRVNSFSIEQPIAGTLNLDGEAKGCTPVSVEVLPKALRIFA